MKLNLTLSAAPFALAVAALPFGAAQAQDAQDARDDDVIIVTAERREATLQETDISMTVLGSQTIEETGIGDILDISRMAPNLIIHEIPTSFGATIGIRGFRNEETISTFEPKVALYLDGVLIAKNAGAAFDVLDLERIEILRGPQGTLYGRNTAGGAVNLITKKPSDEFGGRLSATFGKFEQQDVKATLNVPLVGPNGLLGTSTESSLNLKATFGSFNRDGYWENALAGAPNESFGDRNRLVGHAQLEFKPNDAVSILYAFDRTHIDEINPAAVLVQSPLAFLQPFILTEEEQREIRFVDGDQSLRGDVEGHSLTIAADLNDNLSLVSITAYRTLDTEAFQDSEGSGANFFNTISGDETETATQEVRLVGDAFDDRFEYVIGGFFMDETIPEVFSTNLIASNGGTVSGVAGSAHNKNWALFGEGTAALTDRLDATFGLRYTHERREASRTDTTIVPNFMINFINVLPDAGPRPFDDISGTAGLSYQWTDDIMTYFKASKGYISGGFNVRSPSPATWLRGFDEETVYTYEFGWKTAWWDSRLIVNGALFYSDYNDLQVNLLDPATSRNNISNAASAKMKGGEIEILARLTDNFEVGGGYGYTDAEYIEYFDPVSGVDLTNVNSFAHTPKHTYNVYGRYVVPDFMAAGDLVFRADVSGQSDYTLLTPPGNDADGYALLDARVALESIEGPGDSTITLALWGKNLTNELYYVSGYNLTQLLGFEGRFTGPPRTFGADISIDF